MKAGTPRPLTSHLRVSRQYIDDFRFIGCDRLCEGSSAMSNHRSLGVVGEGNRRSRVGCTQHDHLLLASTIVTTIVVRLCVALVTEGTVDVLNYGRVADAVLQSGPNALYRDTQGIYPYPPLWVWFEVVARLISSTELISFPVAIRLPAIAADAGIVYMVWRWRNDKFSHYAVLWALAYAFNPVSIIVTSLHGQFDSVPALCILYAVYCLLHDRRANASAVTLGLAICFKPYPVLLLPAVLRAIRTPGGRAYYAILCLAPVTVLFAPFLIVSPHAVISQVLDYTGAGLLGFLVPIRTIYSTLFDRSLPVHLTSDIISSSRWVFLIAYLSFLVWSHGRRFHVLATSAVVLVLFYGAFAGIAPQYAVWLMPLLWWAVYRTAAWLLVYVTTTTLALLSFYLYAIPDVFPFVLAVPWLVRAVAYGLCGSLWWFTNVLMLIGLLKRGITWPDERAL
jgi:hypothetical protein